MNALQNFFTTVLNMSITASYVTVCVIIVRLVLRKMPKIFSYALWSVVLFRLICPLSFASVFSILRLLNVDAQNSMGKLEYVPHHIGFMQVPTVQSGIVDLDTAVNSSLPQPTPFASVNPMQIWMSALSIIWLIVIIALLSYSVISYIKMKRNLQTATLVTDNIYESDRIRTAFVCGFVHPKIYVPLNAGDADLAFLLEHERTHIRRKDYLIKPLAFLALVLHWFNPLIWLSFALMSRDMEMSCDESVLDRLGEGVKGGYSSSLLSLSLKRTGLLTANPLAFGESHVKARIKNVLNYRKPAFWIVVTAVAIVCVAAAAFAANPLEPFDLEKANESAMTFNADETNILKIGENAFEHYFSSFNGENIPEEYRITEYRLKDITLLAGDKNEFCVGITSDYSTTGLYFLSANGNFIPNGSGGDCQDDYKEFRIKCLGNNSYRIVSIGTGGGAQGLVPIDQPDSSNIIGGADGQTGIIVKNNDIAQLVEENLSMIISSPKESSNPQDYISAHQKEYEDILKYGGEDALQYMLSQFKIRNAAGLRGQIMMRLCKELLGARNDITDHSLPPQEWYNALSVRQEIKLPDFVYHGNDPIEKLVYATETGRNAQPERGFTIVAPKIFGSYEEDDLLKVFVTTYSATYRLLDNVLEEVSGGVVPAAITYKNDSSGNYVLTNYEQAKDGSYFASSIREFCTMPVSGKRIPGLADKILEHYKDYEDIRKLQKDNLYEHLKANGRTDVKLINARGEIEFF